MIKLPQGRLSPPLNLPQPDPDQQAAYADGNTAGPDVCAGITLEFRYRIDMSDVHGGLHCSTVTRLRSIPAMRSEPFHTSLP
jgi:hypothetical protein